MMDEKIRAEYLVDWVDLKDPESGRYLGRHNPCDGQLQLKFRGRWVTFKLAAKSAQDSAISGEQVSDAFTLRMCNE
jgi:hypothetical protein